MADRTDATGRVKRLVLRVLAVLGGFVVVGMFLLVIVVVAMILSRPGVPSRTILELDLEVGVTELRTDLVTGLAVGRRPLPIRDVVEALEQGAQDDRVLGLVARIASAQLGLAHVEELRDAVLAFRESGKPAVIFSESFGEFAPGQTAYYLATAFDEIYLQPSGDVGVSGLMSEMPFASDLLERIGVEPRLDHRYEYKSALEIFTEEEMTEPHRESVDAVLRSVYDDVAQAVANGRGLPLDEARELIGRGPYYGKEAVEARLVDALTYRTEIYEAFRARLDERAEFLYVDHYLARAGRPHQRGETIALIQASGPVLLGASDTSPLFQAAGIWSENVASAFREAIADDRVRAIVFRVDSPGGSYVGSDVIWREVMQAREAGKPVIASMGNVAGSGGYFIAMAADAIVAQPSTITGSIGVVAGKFVVRDLWDRLGISWDTVSVGENTTMWSSLRDYSPEEWRRLQQKLDQVYDDFTAKAAKNRGMAQAEIHEIARGRIWSGRDALALGLVDELGGLPVALRRAREAAGLAPDADIQIRVLPRRETLLQVIFGDGPSSSRDPAAVGLRTLGVRTARTIEPVADIIGQIHSAPGVLMTPTIW